MYTCSNFAHTKQTSLLETCYTCLVQCYDRIMVELVRVVTDLFIVATYVHVVIVLACDKLCFRETLDYTAD